MDIKLVLHHKQNLFISNQLHQELEKSNEGVLNPYVHYLNIKNHILVLRKHPKMFNPVGSDFFSNILKYFHTQFILF